MYHGYLQMKLKYISGIRYRKINSYLHYIVFYIYTYLYHTMKKNDHQIFKYTCYIQKKIRHRVSDWLRYLTADRLVRVRELPWANICMHQSSLMKLIGHIENFPRVIGLIFGHTSKLWVTTPLSRLKKFTVLHVLNNSGH